MSIYFDLYTHITTTKLLEKRGDYLLGMYTFPDGVLTKQDGSKSTPKSDGLPVTRPFIRLIVGFRGGTSGGADEPTPSRRQPAKKSRESKK